MRGLLRAAEDGTGGAGATAGAAAGAAAAGATTGAAAGADAGAAAAAGAATPYRPDGLPDHLFGTSEKETLDKVWKAYGGARQTIAERGEVPKDAAGYVFEPPEAVKPYVAALETDPFFGKVKDAALAAGLPAKQFNSFLGAIMNEMVGADMVAEPFNADKERALLVPDVTDPTARNAAADRIVRENIARVTAWKDQGMPAEASTFLLSSMDRASANKLVAWIAGARSETAPALTGGSPAGGLSQADLDVRQRDPRNNINSAKFDKAFAAETDALYRKLYGAETRA